MPKAYVTAKNFEDTACAWGYITLCSKCEASVREHPEFYQHIRIDITVDSMPMNETCEFCDMLVSQL